jgi:hypothetical protein
MVFLIKIDGYQKIRDTNKNVIKTSMSNDYKKGVLC